MEPQGARIVVIGGGTGTFTVLSGLKHYARDLSAIVTMADDGGSTGILRDEMGVLPPGDVRQCLVALSPDSHLMRELLNHRFETGQFEGHAFGNLLLSALEQVSGGFSEAVKTAEKILNISGRVIPVTTDNVRLKLDIHGRTVTGEKHIQETPFQRSDKPKLRLEPAARLNPEAAEAIVRADVIVIGPGNLHSSLIPNLLVGGIKEALIDSQARKVFVSNLVNKPNHTAGFQVHDYIDEVERHICSEFFDYVIYGNRRPSQELLESYARQGETWVECDETQLTQRRLHAIGADLLSDKADPQKQADRLLERNLIRHDSQQLAREIMKIYFS